MNERLEDKLKRNLVVLEGNVNYGSSLHLGNYVTLKGNIRIGNHVRIGNHTSIVSYNGQVVIGDGVEIGDCCTIMHRDYAERKRQEILIGEGTILYNGVVIGRDVVIGKICKISDHVKLGKNIHIGDECELEKSAHIAKNVWMGKNNKIYTHAVIGSAPQGLKHEGDGTDVTIGDYNVIREKVEINRGSAERGTGHTALGSHNKILSNSHIAHDCVIGDYNEFVSDTKLAGHVVVGDHVRLSGLGGAAQFVHIGSFSFMGATSKVLANVLPYSRVDGNPAVFKGINTERLRRLYGEGHRNVFLQVKEAHKILRDPEIPDENLVALLNELGSNPAKEISDFIKGLDSKNRRLLRFRNEHA